MIRRIGILGLALLLAAAAACTSDDDSGDAAGTDSADEALDGGFILEADRDALVAEAEASDVGSG